MALFFKNRWLLNIWKDGQLHSLQKNKKRQTEITKDHFSTTKLAKHKTCNTEFWNRENENRNRWVIWPKRSEYERTPHLTSRSFSYISDVLKNMYRALHRSTAWQNKGAETTVYPYQKFNETWRQYLKRRGRPPWSGLWDSYNDVALCNHRRSLNRTNPQKAASLIVW